MFRGVKATGASMRIQRNPGESVEVDWAGDPMVYADPLTGEPRQAWVFVAALSFSAYDPRQPRHELDRAQLISYAYQAGITP